uniref:NOL1/NOP2/Sun domain family member 4 n=1 Tax=Lepeophtheirus salmonis TaxID=72036 RepID=A0A0K2TB90_LEPSM
MSSFGCATLAPNFLNRNVLLIGKHLTFVRHSKKQKQLKDEIRSTHLHLRTLISKKELTPSERALSYFNVYYKKFYGPNWHSIRLGLLSRPKHVALINNFGDSMETELQLSYLGCSNIFPEYQIPIQSDSSEEEPLGVSHGKPSLANPEVEKSEEDVILDELGSMEMDQIEERLIFPNQKISRTGESFESMYEFVPVSELKGMDDFVEESSHYEAYSKVSSQSEFPLQFWKEHFHFRPTLKAFSFPQGDISRFPQPSPDIHKNYNYYCLDGSSLLPVLALNIQEGNTVLDLCSGPGGKALAISQTLLPSKLVCNDSSRSRLNTVQNVFNQYVGSSGLDLDIDFTCSDGEDFFVDYESSFDRVICDVPCSTDRVVVKKNENNIFNPKRAKERIRMPQLQTSLLKSALLCVKPGGYVVYSTCSLSPAQNDGVVHASLKELWEDAQLEFSVCDMSDAIEPLKTHFRFASGMHYGQQIIPVLYNNFGPMYFAKLKRLHQKN